MLCQIALYRDTPKMIEHLNGFIDESVANKKTKEQKITQYELNKHNEKYNLRIERSHAAIKALRELDAVLHE